MNTSNRYLTDFDGRRDNNFTVIRLLLAWAVLYGHSFPIQSTKGIPDPLTQLFQGSTWVGAIAVDGFFAISGFLVTASLLRRGAVDYCLSRLLRVLPGLMVCVALSVFVLGPIMTSLPVAEYFSHPKTLQYLSNAFAFPNVQWVLPGVFENNPKTAINGSLWTLSVEVRCYVFLVALSAFYVFRTRIMANAFLLALFLFGAYFFSEIPLLGNNSRWTRTCLYFLLGVAFYINRDLILIHYRLALLALILTITAFGEQWFPYVFPVSLTYLIFYLAYGVKHIDLDKYLGDISYGVYIYAWPVQQIVASYLPGDRPYLHAVIASIIVAILAFASWRLIEKPALGLKKKLLKPVSPPPAPQTHSS
ncbi:acyltransferase [Gilvimarinus agarilyticus]|uniref:acyltransferase family protein n=1 Tax=Gilvimarinus sp. 2_MG-2023 TaxID=3062666 RepID=UPI001C08ADFB|nr:acyltransferase [Gilvimarinus sp. 2_MG-2023]MBU2887811.1 acyltransferase [Gilvimarinus agarilyticus]MDO6572450.1 acyltransferase [Gilvimarinus sp. 2_MG-2023]